MKTFEEDKIKDQVHDQMSKHFWSMLHSKLHKAIRQQVNNETDSIITSELFRPVLQVSMMVPMLGNLKTSICLHNERIDYGKKS